MLTVGALVTARAYTSTPTLAVTGNKPVGYILIFNQTRAIAFRTKRLQLSLESKAVALLLLKMFLERVKFFSDCSMQVLCEAQLSFKAMTLLKRQLVL